MYFSRQLQKRAESERTKVGMTFRHFRRLLGYTWPHKRYLFPAIGCILLMAITYSVSIGSILPVLTVLVKPQGLHGWVNQYIAENRIQGELAIYDVLRHDRVEGVPAAAAKIRSLQSDSPLATEAGLREGDFILAVNGVSGDAVVVFREIVAAGPSMSVTYVSFDDARQGTATVTVPPLDRKLAALHALVDWIPRGRSPEQRWRTLAVVLMLLLGVVFVGSLARLFAEYFAVLVNSRAIVDLRRQMYSHVLNMPLSQFSECTSDTMSKFIQDMQDIFRGLNNFFQKLVTEPFKAMGAITLAFMLNWRLTLAILLVAPFAAILLRKMGSVIRRANRKLLIGYGHMLGRLESTLSGMRVVKAYTREHYERRQLFHIDRRLLKQQLKMAFIEAMTSPAIELLAFAAAATAILYFAVDILQHPDRTPEFMTMLVCFGAIFDPVRKLSTIYPKLQRANAAAQRVFELIDSPSEYDLDAGKKAIGPLQRSIEFENVSFTYPGATQPAVRDLNLTIHKGEIIAIVGPNGSGKTTLLSLLPRLFPLDDGRILVDGQDVSDVKLRSLRRQFSIITQESVIFADTVRENIAYGRPDAQNDEIEAAARRAFADEFIQQMPHGYDSMVGEHGATLSGGQRQRLAIARAILRDAPIVIFDEATSQVDPESELKIHQALEAFLENRTAFIIAHRFSTISNADRIAVMDQGRLVAVGTHDQLMTTCPLYRRLYETQFREAG